MLGRAAQSDHDALAALEAYELDDEVLHAVLERTWTLLLDSEPVAGLDDLALHVADFRGGPAILQESRYATKGVKALPAESIIVADERFLLETEAVVRAFEQSESLFATPYLRSDEDLFGLVERIESDPGRYVRRLRRLDAYAPERDERARDILTLVFLFFFGHEVGHLGRGNEARDFTSFVDPGARVETRVTNAVVKLRRHAEEFKAYSFDLPGFEAALEAGSDVEQASAASQREIERIHANHTKWFADESAADEVGARIMVDHVNRAAADDEDAADERMYYAVRGLFAAALYSWYKDLRAFFRAIGTDLLNAKDLSLKMAESRMAYVHAASLFGDVHRFTLLRAERTAEALIKSRSDVFDPDGVDFAPGDETQRALRLGEAVRRYFFLAIMMDTAVKIAYLGASTAWILETDERRGTPQGLLMTFESVAAAMDRLRNAGRG